jgi:hypothetical protein
VDEILSLLFNPDFQFGVIAGGGTASALFVLFAVLADLRDRAGDRRQAGHLDRAERLQRSLEGIHFGGDLPATPPVPEAANDAAVDLRDAYRRPRGKRAELRSAPR